MQKQINKYSIKELISFVRISKQLADSYELSYLEEIERALKRLNVYIEKEKQSEL